MISVSFRNVSKTFVRQPTQMLARAKLKRLFSPASTEVFHALRDVSFDVPTGHGLAVIGSNGAGKSTLLALVAGIAEPTSGAVYTKGRISPLLELGSGFHPDLTGRENVFLNASLLGLSESDVRREFDSIIAFSELEEFIDQPLRTYSSGMVLRLAFSVAVSVDPDILLVDEVLAVGDGRFQTKCFEKIRGFRERGKTFVCVSHSAAMVRAICDQALWLHHGAVVAAGRLDNVYAAYAEWQKTGVMNTEPLHAQVTA